MIKFKQGNILKENTEALVNTVNCAGVMGKGIALQFKQAFPDNFKEYKKICDGGHLTPGMMFITSTNQLFPKYIINFPTKRHWRGNSQLTDIKAGLQTLIQEVKRLGIKSIAIPPLGCGNGGLDWSEVKPLIVEAFALLEGVEVIIFEPIGSPAVTEMKVTTETPNMTLGRALLIHLLELYGIPGYKLTKLEIQKLAYFLQVAGEPLRLRYGKNQYGPYADNLNHVLQKIEGHFIKGYGDRTQQSQIYVLPEGREKANQYLQQHPEAKDRLNQVAELIMGFENPYGLEMLATIHWVVTQEDNQASNDVNQAIKLVYSWNERKRQLFKENHLKKAWERLAQQNWFNLAVN
ncbi:macro domain-containing protein [Geminocystis sp. GBBB08]|uniref:type II toxin-antitoxin system antitoxin DNA ADP-ribosyl glycohydrolase DarG n=1 Tax=Geminocystis sp. GBBB08 TaxID=2604140 RepID=UPI0027E225D2|nr:macro domain-containing protein [Geminocystis sp. GBBB08]MBL1209860.1 Appr-1-p processing protein [Geminocystis sp. GBBB08]